MFTCEKFGADSRVVHGFTARSDQAGQRLHLGTGASRPDWDRAADEVGVGGWPVAYASQVHGDTVLWTSTEGCAGEADALLTRESGLLVAVRTADCVPILIRGEGVVGAVHAGWRGLASGIILKACQMLQDEGPLEAVVGPAICGACYEVGDEVVDAIAAWTDRSLFVIEGPRKAHIDPGAAAAAQLRSAGVSVVTRLSICTHCDARLWSHRQEGSRAGRQAGLVGRRC